MCYDFSDMSEQHESHEHSATPATAIEATLHRLLSEIRTELQELLQSGRNFKLTVNSSAGGKSCNIEVQKVIRISD